MEEITYQIQITNFLYHLNTNSNTNNLVMLRKTINFFEAAGKLAKSKVDKRTFFLGAIGVRKDGTIVRAMNGSTNYPQPSAHAEARLSKKLDKGATVFVARVNAFGEFALSKPCHNCMRTLKARKVKRVYYTVGPNEFEWMDL